MKYIIVICDGAADWPIEELGNKTIFEATETPNLDWLASHGQMGLLRTIPIGMAPGSECANMTILGYHPEKELTGRGPLEALSMGIPLRKEDIAFRCNVITIKDGLIDDYCSDHITSEEAKVLIQDLQANLGGNGTNFHSGVQFRHVLIIDGEKHSEDIETTPPHDQLDKAYKDFLIKPKNNNDVLAKETADYLNDLIEKSHPILINNPVNIKRKEKGLRMATHIWPWSGGKKPSIIPFPKKYALEGSVISAVDLIFGLGIAAGLEPVHVKGATGLPDTNYKGKVEAAIQELTKKDFVFLHVEATDEMGHTGIPEKKMMALEYFDKKIVAPLLKAEEKFNDELVIVVLPDHPTPLEIRTHTDEPVPFVIYNPKNKRQNENSRPFSEAEGEKGELGLIEDGEAFIKKMLS